MEEPGGTLKLRISEIEATKLSHPPSDIILPEIMLLLEITDTGCGISGEAIDHIFEPYFTTKRVGEGTGFGLALVHGIVKSHNGYIEVDSQVGHGTCFRIYLPQRTKQHEVKSSKVQTSLPAGTGHVLLVDDELQQLELGRTFLERLGFTVTAAQSGKEAVDNFANSPFAFDVLITDQTMPPMTDLELSMWVRTIRTDIPIILCTGVSHALSTEKIRSADIIKVVKKPYSLAELAEILQQVVK